MRAVLIDPVAQKITEIEIDYARDGIQSIYKALEIKSPFDCVHLDDGDAIYVDDEGLLKEGQSFFMVGSMGAPLAGRGLLLGSDDEGETVEPKLSAAELRTMVQFVEIMRVRR